MIGCVSMEMVQCIGTFVSNNIFHPLHFSQCCCIYGMIGGDATNQMTKTSNEKIQIAVRTPSNVVSGFDSFSRDT